MLDVPLFSDKSKKIIKGPYRIYRDLWLSVTSRRAFGTNVFERDWDTLIVLDACRVDAMREVMGEYEYITEVESIWSVGTNSYEWYVKTFVEEYSEVISQTALISANPFAKHLLINEEYPPRDPTPVSFCNWNTVTKEDFGHLEMTQDHERPYGDISDIAPVSTYADIPDYVTDRGIVAGRSKYEKLIVHYYQPHRPFIHNLVTNETMSYVEDQPFPAIKEGKATVDEVWDLYLDNLRLALDSIEVLLENVDSEKVVITADHGELFGEWRLYGHHYAMPHPNLKKVPWIETTAEDNQNRHPEEEFELNDGIDAEKRLKDLGYLA